MQRKVFIGIDLDEHVKSMLVKSVKKWHNLPIKWHKEESLHIALLPIGWVTEDDVFDISDAIEDACNQTRNFSIAFDKIVTVTKKKDESTIKNAQSIRLEGDDSDELKELYMKLEESLGVPVTPKKHFKPLVTLGRMRAKKWQELEEYPDINIDFPLMMDVYQVTLFESVQIDGKWTVVPVEVFDLQ
jgi:2'-5' RNA ligase